MPVRHRSKSAKQHKRVYPRANADNISLTTITEEPPSLPPSHEIVIQPEVVVQTTMTTNTPSTNDSQHLSKNTTNVSIRLRLSLCLNILHLFSFSFDLSELTFIREF